MILHILHIIIIITIIIIIIIIINIIIIVCDHYRHVPYVSCSAPRAVRLVCSLVGRNNVLLNAPSLGFCFETLLGWV